MEILEQLHQNPIIASVRDMENLNDALESEAEFLCLLTGDIVGLRRTVRKIKTKDKKVLVHADLIRGLSRDPIVIQYLQDEIGVDGILSTSATLIKEAKSRGMFTILRLFLLDNMALENGINSINSVKPDAIEVLPAMAREIQKITKKTNIPVIGGGFIETKEDVISSLKAGAIAVSSSTRETWGL